MPQGSILGPLLFNIYINDIFWFTPDVKITNYADDTTPYATNKNVERLLEILEQNTSKLMQWFDINYMKLNEKKCQLLVTDPNPQTVKLGNYEVNSSSSVKLLGVTIDNKLSFNEHVTKLCKKANTKLNALARISHIISTTKLRLLMKAFVESHFSYCPLIWMFHSRTLNGKINRIHERALRIVYKDHRLTFQELLDLDGTVTIHHRNLQKLAIEMYKVKHNLAPEILSNIYVRKQIPYNLRNAPIWATSNIKSVSYGSETLSFRGPKTWNMLPDDIQNASCLNEFKRKIKTWKPTGCTCRLCKTYIPSLGFL